MIKLRNELLPGRPAPARAAAPRRATPTAPGSSAVSRGSPGSTPRACRGGRKILIAFAICFFLLVQITELCTFRRIIMETYFGKNRTELVVISGDRMARAAADLFAASGARAACDNVVTSSGASGASARNGFVFGLSPFARPRITTNYH